MNALLKISLALNAILCVAVLYLTKPGTPRMPEVESLSRQNAAERLPKEPKKQANAEPMPFHWRQLESPDYRVYIANLRGVGCPEQTVRDIIAADVESQFAARRHQLQSHAVSQAALESGLRTLQQKEINLLDNLLGIHPVSQDTEAAPASESPSSVHARWKSPVQECIETPLALQTVNPAAFHLTDEQAEVLNGIRENFINAIGGPNQDPSDPEYRQRWQRAQPEADDMVRGMLGVQTWLQLEQAAADQYSSTQ